MSGAPALSTGLPAPSAPLQPLADPLSDPNAVHFLRGVARGLNIPESAPDPTPQASGGGVRQQVAQLWSDAGYPEAAVQGIVKRVGDEGDFNPRAIGDDGSSFRLYQHHGDRAVKLQQWAQNQGLNPADPVTQTKFAIAEMNGLDPKAAKAKNALMQARDPQQAYGEFTSSFERPANTPGSEATNLRSTAQGSFNGPAAAMLQQWQGDMQRRGAEYDAALADAKDLHSASRAALAQWEQESNKPPQNMHQAWSEWSGLASVLALVGGALGGRHMTASLGAAGAMLQAANAADVQTYDRQYAQWKNHLDNGLKLVDLLHTEARDIVDDAHKSYEEKVQELQTLSSAYQLQQQLDPGSVGNLTKNIQLMRDRQQLIQAQNSETEVRNAASEKDAQWLKDHPEAGGAVPASVHLQNIGEAKREGSGTMVRPQQPHEIEVTANNGQVIQRGGAYQTASGQWLWIGTNEPVDVPSGGNVNLKSTQQPRSGSAMAVQKFMQEHPDATSAEITRFSADYGRSVAVERAFGSGAEAKKVTSLNTVADHALLLKEYAQALGNGQVQIANSVLNRLARETGSPEITNFQQARDFFADEVASVLAQAGGGVADRAEAKARISEAQSPEQLAGAIDTAGRFVTGRLHAFEQQYAGNDPERREHFEGELLTPGARQWFDQFKGRMPGAGGTQYTSPDDIYRSFDAGKITKDQAKQLLIDNFGFRPQ